MNRRSQIRWNAGHAIVAGLGLLCMLMAVRLVVQDRRVVPAMPAMSAPALADPALLARQDLFFAAGASGEALPVTSLPFSLHGLRTDAATGRGGAIIAGPDGAQNSYQVGDDLGDGVTLAAIAFDHVVLEREGRREALWLDSGGDSPQQVYDPGMPATSPSTAMRPEPEGADETINVPTGAADLPAAPRDQEGND